MDILKKTQLRILIDKQKATSEKMRGKRHNGKIKMNQLLFRSNDCKRTWKRTIQKQMMLLCYSVHCT